MRAGLSPRELAHILAALRYCQDRGIDLSTMEHFEGETFKALTPQGVDKLCEWLNEHGMVRDRLQPATPAQAVPVPPADSLATVTLTFPMPACDREAKLAVHAGDLASAWHNFLENYLRPRVKWPPDSESEEVRKRTQEIFDSAWETVRDFGVADLISG